MNTGKHRMLWEPQQGSSDPIRELREACGEKDVLNCAVPFGEDQIKRARGRML